MLPQLICGALEKAINAVLGDDPDSLKQLRTLAGKRMALQLRELPFPLLVQFCDSEIMVLARAEAPLDAQVELGLVDLPQLTDAAALTGLIKSERLILQGDAELLQQFARLLKDNRVDLEELLSRYTGDIAAHHLGQATRRAGRYLQRQRQDGQASLFEYLTDEVMLLPHPKMLNGLKRDVAALEKDTQSLEARLEKIEALSLQRNR